MLNYKIILLVLLVGWLFFGFNGLAALAEEEETEYAEDPNYTLEVPIGSVTQVKNVSEYINIVYQFGISIIGIIATVMIMYGGIKWITAAGNETRISSARETITSAVIGLVLALCSYLILFTINPRLVAWPEVLIPVIQPESAAEEIECVWLEESANEEYAEVQDSSCQALDKPDADYKCFCNLRGNIVALARQYVASPVLYWTCCWGWAHDIYVLADVAPKTASVATSEIKAGDWLYIYNGNNIASNGQHSVIFLGWTDQANLKGECAGANPYKPSISECDFQATPVATVFIPYPSDYKGVAPDEKVSSGSHPGVCGGMDASDLTVGKDR